MVRCIGVGQQTAFNTIHSSRDKRKVAGYDNFVIEKLNGRKTVYNLYHYGTHILQITFDNVKEDNAKVKIMGGFSQSDTKHINGLLYLLLLDNEYKAVGKDGKITLKKVERDGCVSSGVEKDKDE